MNNQTAMAHGFRRASSRVLMAVLAAGLLGIPAAHPVRAALTTVSNGIATTDLTAIGMTAATLATDLVGTGVTIDLASIVVHGNPTQLGTVDITDGAVVSFNHGVILSSGDISNVIGPNKSEGTTGIETGAEDTDLTALIASTATVFPMTYDAASLEFDFTPNANDVYFTYVFGSDEYLEWVNLFNDVFAFYIGDGPSKANCATVGGNPVSIDTVNSTVNSGSYRDNSYMSPPASPLNIETDGLSVELICHAAVTSGVKTHLKMAIADTSDQILDSVVMIKTGSLSTTPPESCNNLVDDDVNGQTDMADTKCSSTVTTPPPSSGGGGIGTSNNNPPFTGSEGEDIILDASALGWTATPNTVSTSWSVTATLSGTGTCSIVESGKQPLVAGQIAIAHLNCTDEGEYTVRVDMWDAEGGSDNDKDVDFFVQNAPPAVAITTPTIGDGAVIGDTVHVNANVIDPSKYGANPGDAVTCAVDWGDGTKEPIAYDAPSDSCGGDHVYASAATSVISVTATDNVGDAAAAATLLAVTDGLSKLDQTLSWTVAPPASAVYGDQFTVAASGGGSGNDLVYGASGGCSNDGAGADITMTSSTDDCLVVVDQAGNDSYNDAVTLTASVTTGTRDITVTADPQTKARGDLDPILGYQITSGSLAGVDTLAGELDRDPGEDLDTYQITQGTLEASADYVLTYVPALLTIVDETVPTATAPVAAIRTGAALVGTAIPVTLAWTGADEAGGTGLHHYEVARSANGCSTFGVATTVSSSAASVTWSTTVPSTGNVCFRVRSFDAAGNASNWETGPLLTPRLTQQSSSLVKYVKTWTLAASAKYSGSSEKYTKTAKATATYKVAAQNIALVITRGTGRGKVGIWVDGVLVKTVDTKASATQYRYIAWQTALTPGTHTIKLVVAGTAGRPRVDLDAFAILK